MGMKGGMGIKLRDVYDSSRRTLEGTGCTSPELDTRVLMGLAFGLGPAGLVTSLELVAEPSALERFNRLLERRSRGEPISHILGYREFYSRRFAVGPEVLSPRPETELLVERTLGIIRGLSHTPRVLDIGTGSGCIAITLALEHEGASIVATDISRAALEVAGQNALTLGAAALVEFRHGDMFEPVEGMVFDVVVANPPYISLRDYEGLSADARDYEPPLALVGGVDGLDLIKRVASGAPLVLGESGECLVEIGAEQGRAAAGAFRDAGFAEVSVERDLAGLDRIVVAKWKK